MGKLKEFIKRFIEAADYEEYLKKINANDLDEEDGMKETFKTGAIMMLMPTTSSVITLVGKIKRKKKDNEIIAVIEDVNEAEVHRTEIRAEDIEIIGA